MNTDDFHTNYAEELGGIISVPPMTNPHPDPSAELAASRSVIERCDITIEQGVHDYAVIAAKESKASESNRLLRIASLLESQRDEARTSSENNAQLITDLKFRVDQLLTQRDEARRESERWRQTSITRSQILESELTSLKSTLAEKEKENVFLARHVDSLTTIVSESRKALAETRAKLEDEQIGSRQWMQKAIEAESNLGDEKAVNLSLTAAFKTAREALGEARKAIRALPYVSNELEVSAEAIKALDAALSAIRGEEQSGQWNCQAHGFNSFPCTCGAAVSFVKDQAGQKNELKPLTGTWDAKCAVCGEVYPQHCGSTPCCGAIAFIINHKPATQPEDSSR